MRQLFSTLLVVISAFGAVASAEGETKVHEEGRCAIRGHCGKKSFFGGNLPCPDNGKAEDPDDDVRKKLVGLCGKKWEDGPVCCKEEQVSASASNIESMTSCKKKLTGSRSMP